MAQTIANAVKNLLEGAGLGIDAYRDTALNNPLLTRPFVTITEGISITGDVRGGDNGADAQVVEVIQVDVWEDWLDENDQLVESPDLAQRVQRVLHGAQLNTAPMRVYSVYAPERRRLLEEENNVVHNAITATIRRTL